jgi:hypothetical protein
MRMRPTLALDWALNRCSLLSALVLMSAAHANPSVAAPSPCDFHLIIVFSPAAPNPSDAGFLKSLLSNHSGYRLTLSQSAPGSVAFLELTGAGPDNECQNVLASIRRDARVHTVLLYQPPF